MSCGDEIENKVIDDRRISRWELNYPTQFVSFNIGYFDSKEIKAENLPVVRSYLSKNIDHKAMALYLAYYGTLSSGDMLGNVAADVTNSLNFFTNTMGPIPFNSILVTEIPYSHGQGMPGLLLLSWGTYQTESISGSDVSFRAHETSHQWWGNVVGFESYRDYWLVEALAEYCGYWFFQMSVQDKGKCESMLKEWRSDIKSGNGAGSKGSEAGPPVLGYRLNSSKTDDYIPVVYSKGAYIFHMIRYMLHDYKTGSDILFSTFLKDIVDTYGEKSITTYGVQQILEKYTGEDMTWFFDQWVYGIEIPKYTFDYESEATPEGKYKVTCSIKQEEVPDDFQMLVPITVVFDNDRYVHLKLWIDQPEAIVDLPLLPFEPEEIIFNTYDAVLTR